MGILGLSRRVRPLSLVVWEPTLRLQQRVTGYPGTAVSCQCGLQREYLFGKMVWISDSRLTNTNELNRYKHSQAVNVFWR